MCFFNAFPTYSAAFRMNSCLNFVMWNEMQKCQIDWTDQQPVQQCKHAYVYDFELNVII